MDIQQHADALDLDLGAIMKIIVRLTEVRDGDTLFDLLKFDVSEVLHHEGMICGHGFAGPHGIYVHHLLQHNYPRAYFDSLAAPNGKADSPLIRRWRATAEPVMFQTGRDDDNYPEEWVDTFKRYGLRNTVAHGVLDVHSTYASYFVFTNIAGEVGEKEIFVMKLLTPHLHFALMRTMANHHEDGKSRGALLEPITERQKEILHWMNQGKTNWEIAQILSMSENNVKYNIEQILSKLEVRNRTQAVSKALLFGLLNSSSSKVLQALPDEPSLLLRKTVFKKLEDCRLAGEVELSGGGSML